MKEITQTTKIEVIRYNAKAGEAVMTLSAEGEILSLHECARDASISLPATGKLFVGTLAELKNKKDAEGLVIKADRLKAEAEVRMEEARNKKEVKQ